MTQPEQEVRMFALTREQEVVGYGLVLPDSSAFSVSWPGPGTAMYSSSTAEDCAELRGADLEWVDE